MKEISFYLKVLLVIRSIVLTLLVLLLGLKVPIYAKDIDLCLFEKLKEALDDQTVGELRSLCSIEENVESKPEISERLEVEHLEAFNPYMIMPHKMNYILPISYTDNINKDAYNDQGNWSENLKNIEAKFQISLKVPLTESIFKEGDNLAFGFTLQSWWQLYAEEISRPFRETNYQPELFYFSPLDWQPAGGKTGYMIGLEHQSNGRAQALSRSWNRVYLNFFYAKGDFVASFRPWYRIPEGDKETTPEESGDDNPDIDEYMGHFELAMAYKWDEYEFAFKGRQNFKEHHGGMELGFTFPLSGRLRGYLQYTNGYGESLIDYNHSQQRFGIGIALTDMF